MENSGDRDILERIFKLEQENYRILKAMRSSQRWSVFWGFLKSLFVVIPLVAGYFYLQPYLQAIWKTYSQVQGQVSGLHGQIGGGFPNFAGFLNQWQQPPTK